MNQETIIPGLRLAQEKDLSKSEIKILNYLLHVESGTIAEISAGVGYVYGAVSRKLQILALKNLVKEVEENSEKQKKFEVNIQ